MSDTVTLPAPDRLAAYARQAVPRYTSYPTAPHFRPDFPASDYADWLAALDPVEPVSLYLHVPFCRQMCWYCGCNMKLAARYAPVASYVRSLLDEIDFVAAHLPGRLSISHLHWGGGTPTALEPDDLERVMRQVAACFDFAPGAEIAIESDPRTLTDAMIDRIGTLGFSRASFGVQEFDPRVQAAINRIQPPEMVERTVDGLRAAGVAGINFDLIYGLPYQSVETLIETIAHCERMRPDRIALFGYAHVPWMAKNQRMIPDEALPDGTARAAQASAAAAALVAAGYEAIGLDHFALPGDDLAVAARAGSLRRNFQGYTTDTAATLIGLGATSISQTPKGYVQNIAETGAWARAIEAGQLPVARGVAFTAEDRLRREVIERIMCDGAVDLDAMGGRPGWWAAEREALDAMAADGLLSRDGGRLTLTPAGRGLCRVVAAVFDAYLARSEARHSVAV
jgi:oxygen-independent coproporphyrinogen III oxidase